MSDKAISREYHGVFLFSQKCLQELDALVQSHFKTIQKITRDEINRKKKQRKVESEEKYSYISDEAQRQAKVQGDLNFEIGYLSYDMRQEATCSWTVDFHKRDSVSASTLTDILRKPDNTTLDPRRVHLRLCCGHFQASITLVEDAHFTAPVQFNCAPTSRDQSQRFFADFEEWTSNCKIAKPFYWWRNVRILFRYIFICLSLFCILTLLTAEHMPKPDLEMLALHSTAERISTDGVTEANEREAIHTLLKLHLAGDKYSNAINPPKRILFTPGLIFGYISTWIFFGIMSCPPTTTLGIGRGTTRVNWQLKLVRFWSVAVPAYVIFGLSPSLFASAIWEWIKTLTAG